jgi:hypothetical protein
MERESVLGNLRPAIRSLVESAEARAGVKISFQTCHVREVLASFQFDPQRPTINLSPFARDVDIAHEVVHMVLQLIEGYPMFQWRPGVPQLREVAGSIAIVHSYVQDEEVHRRLLELGLRWDGEVIRPQFFDDLCTVVPRGLREGRPRSADGMSHLDAVGHGHLRRSAFLVQAELIRKRSNLSPLHAARLDDLIQSMRKYRRPEAIIADEVLGFFAGHDVTSIEGQSRVLQSWAALEGLDSYVEVSSYHPAT